MSGAPSIDIAFKNAASTVLRRAARGIVGVILLDSTSSTHGAHVMTDTSQIPAALSADNKAYLTRAFTGYATQIGAVVSEVKKPKKVYAFVLAADATDLSDALDYYALHKINYLVGPPTCDSTQATEIDVWIEAQRALKRKPKTVLPSKASDSFAIINFDTDGIVVGEETFTTAEFCSRMAGLIAATPLERSCTYAPLPEVTDVERLSASEINTAVGAGKLILFHDGEKVKIVRGVNSFQTTTTDYGEIFKKIKILDLIDFMTEDIDLLIADNYVGKRPNTYDNKCVLIAAIKSYFSALEDPTTGLLLKGATTVEINVAKNITYLTEQGTDTSEMTDDEIKKAYTGTHVYLKGKATTVDDMEDFELDFEV